MKAFSFNYIFVFVIALFFLSCDKDPVIPNEEELITTLQYVLTPAGGGSPVIMNFNDPDGDGGISPVVTGGLLQSNSSYTGQISLTNTSVEPWINITDEISEEAADHQFFFIPEDVNLQVTYADTDANSNPVGIASTMTTTNASEGRLKIILRHLPNKTAAGVSAGNIQNAGGETDIEVSFPVRVE